MGCKKYTTISIANPSVIDQEKGNVRVLVNPEKAYNYLPRETLENLGLRPVGTMDFRTEDGKVIQRDLGYALIRSECCKKKPDAVVPVVFVDDNEREPTLGATGLEALGLVLTLSNRLKSIVPVVPTITRVWP